MKNVLLSVMLTFGVVAGAMADPSPRLYLSGELLKGEESIMHFAYAVKSGEDAELSSLLQNSYLNAADDSNKNTRLVPWPYFTGVMIKMNAMLSGDGSVLLTAHGFQSTLTGTKKNPIHPELDMPEVSYKKISARSILDQQAQKDIALSVCAPADKKPKDCAYTLRITVTK